MKNFLKVCLCLMLSVLTIVGAAASPAYAYRSDDSNQGSTGSKAATKMAKASLTIKKVDTNGAALGNAEFAVKNGKGEIVEIVTTMENTGLGSTKEAIDTGRYLVEELRAPDGYIPTTASQWVEVEGDKNPETLVFCNEKKGGLVVYTWSPDRFPISGVPVTVLDSVDNHEVARAQTNEDGWVAFEELEPGTYTVTALDIREEYNVIDPIQSRVVIRNDRSTSVDFVHVPEGTIMIQTFDAITHKPIQGAKYQVIGVTHGNKESNYETDANGNVTTQPLDYGKYEVKQIDVPDGYLLDTTTHTVEVFRDQVNYAQFYNQSKATLVIEAVESGKSDFLAGATFVVEGPTTHGDTTEVFRGTTTEDGVLEVEKLEPGHYTVKCIADPEGYSSIQKSLSLDVTVQEKTEAPLLAKFEFHAHNHIVLNLTDEETHEPLGGAEFRIEDMSGNVMDTIVTNAEGVATSKALPTGTYKVFQLIAPAHYLLSQTFQDATMTVKNTGDTVLDFTNRRISGITIQALTETDHEPLAGAEFEVWIQNGKLVDTVVTDAAGQATVYSLSPDTYVVKEVKVPGGYTARTLTQNVIVTFGKVTTVDFYHTAESQVTINKTDANTGVPLAGATFRIAKANGDFVGEYTTDIAGKIVIPTLAAGQYTVVEIKAPQGYVLDPTSHNFTVKDEQPVVVDLVNEPEANFRIDNTCAQDGKPIAGNTFHITSYDGTVIGNYVTNAAGIINVNLAAGTYTVSQTYVAEGYVLNTEVWNVVIRDGDTKVLEVKNQKESGITVRMIDKDTKDGIYGVEMEIRDQKNNIVGRFRSDNDGYVYLTGVLTPGRYTVELFSVPDGYNKDNIPKTFEVKLGETTKVVWELQGTQGQVTIVTFSGEDSTMMNIRKNSVLPGAVYQITDTTGKIVKTITGGADGRAYSGALSLGTYYIQQMVAPSGYQVNSAHFAVHVTSLNDNINVEVYNKAANYQTKLQMGGQASAMAGAQVKYYFFVENASTSAMNNFYLHLKVPTDAMRANMLYTGTFGGAATTFSVQYKTNMNDYRTLATGLNSKSNYSYGLSSTALGLQYGEYVTDVRLVFDKVVAGFKTNMQTTLTCQVLSTVVSGYQAVFKAEVGAINGYYNNTSNGGQWGNVTGQSFLQNPSATTGNTVGTDSGWTSAASQYTTFIYSYYQSNVLPNALPKTGF